MQSINDLNSQYHDEKRRLTILERYENEIATKKVSFQNDPISKAIKAVSHLDQLQYEVSLTGLDSLRDTITIGNGYALCIAAIKNYQKALARACTGDTTSIRTEISRVSEAQEYFNEQQKLYSAKYGFEITSADALYNAIVDSIKQSVSKVRNSITLLKQTAKTCLSEESSTILRGNDSLVFGKKPPEQLFVAREYIKGETLPLLRDIGISSTSHDIILDLKQQGNLMIETGYHCQEDQQIDEFIVAYIFRFIESYPLGAVNVHIFDQNTSFLYKRLKNCFQSENTGDLAKRTVQIYAQIIRNSSVPN